MKMDTEHPRLIYFISVWGCCAFSKKKEEYRKEKNEQEDMWMTSFIIVDDEPLALESFAELLDWNQYGYTLLGCAANGVAAMQLIREKKPDIIFTDIRMPSMDGLELCKRVREKYPDIKIVILTAYRDFDYAKQALSCGVTEYLLKNQVEEDVVLPLLDRLSAEIEKQRRSQGISRNHYYQSLMLDMQPEEEPDIQWESRQCCRMLLKCRCPYILEELAGFRMEEVNLNQKEIEKLIPEDGELGILQLLWLGAGIWGLLICAKGKEFFSLSEEKAQLRELFSRIQEYFREKYGVEVAALFDVGIIRPEVLKSSFHEMQDFSGCTIFMDKTEIVPYIQLKNFYQSTDTGHVKLREMMEVAGKAVRSGKREQLLDVLNELKKEYTIPYYNLGRFRYICGYLFYQLDQLRNENSLPALKEYVLRQKDELSGILTAEQVWDWVRREFLELAFMAADAGPKVKNRKIAQSLEYIHEHYQKKLTARQVGEQVGFSEVYFSNLFKKELGMTFGDYLTAYRMNVAKFLFAKGDYKVYQVAEMTGYTSPQYFSQLFQKETGYTPMEYMTILSTINEYREEQGEIGI